MTNDILKQLVDNIEQLPKYSSDCNGEMYRDYQFGNYIEVWQLEEVLEKYKNEQSTL